MLGKQCKARARMDRKGGMTEGVETGISAIDDFQMIDL